MYEQFKDLYPYNTFRIRAKAKEFFSFSDAAYLRKFLRSHKCRPSSCFMLGGGSNVLFTHDFDGLIIHPENKGIEIMPYSDDRIKLKIEAGETWEDLVKYAVANGFCGIENLAMIPGSVGSAVVQNIGAYGRELADVFYAVEGLYLRNGENFRLNPDECQFGYRDSVFKHTLKGQAVITSVEILLKKHFEAELSYGGIRTAMNKKKIQKPSLQDVFDTICEIRSSKLPSTDEFGSAGSFFKNPVVDQEFFETFIREFPTAPNFVQTKGVKLAAGWLVEQCGWKGYRQGDAGVYPHQALVLVNYGHASGAEIHALADQIRMSVFDQFGINLQPEVIIL